MRGDGDGIQNLGVIINQYFYYYMFRLRHREY